MTTTTSPPKDTAPPPLRLRLRAEVDAKTEKIALRAALTAAHLLGLAMGRLLRDVRSQNDPLAETLARLKEAHMSAALAWDLLDVMGSRMDKIPERRRPYYTPGQRFRILEIKDFLGWNRDLIARTVRVCSNTISNWEKSADPAAKTVGSTVKAVPPLVRIADVGRNIAQALLRFKLGEDMVSMILARAGWKVSARSVQRIGREGKRENPRPTPPTPGRHGNPVIARFVNHTWMMDVSVVQAFLGGEFYMAAVFDAFSRSPLTVATYDKKPGASAMARILKAAAKTFGSPKYLITDQGKEFTGKVLRKAASRLGIVHRLGSTENIFATARIERFWRTLKHTASLRLQPPLTQGDLEGRLETALTHYLCFRPHQGLHGSTPAEAFLGIEPASTKAVMPPRGRPGEGPLDPPFVIDFLDRENRTFPFLKTA